MRGMNIIAGIASASFGIGFGDNPPGFYIPEPRQIIPELPKPLTKRQKRRLRGKGQ